MKIAFLADEISTFRKDHDSTWALMLEAHRQGYEVYSAQADTLAYSVQVYALFQELDNAYFKSQSEQVSNIRLTSPTSQSQKITLDDFELVFMRKDPPVGPCYWHQLQMLTLCKRALVLNRPQALMNFNEKLSILRFPDLISPTLVSNDKAQIQGFLDEHNKIVIKPLDGKGGEGIFVVSENDKNFSSIIELSTDRGRNAIMAQKYIEAINEGDKRIIMIKGKPEGIMLRVPDPNDNRANMAVGGSIAKCDFTKRDYEICAALEDFLVTEGIYLAGIDIIGNYLTEINITSPTCLQEINRLNAWAGDQKLEARILHSVCS
jgi:glutathione synthase